MDALRSIQEEFGASFEELFETITTDNGTEFSRLPELEEGRRLRIYYAHPYCPSDKGMIENMNRIIRRFIPKGERLENCTADGSLRYNNGSETWHERNSATILHRNVS